MKACWSSRGSDSPTSPCGCRAGHPANAPSRARRYACPQAHPGLHLLERRWTGPRCRRDVCADACEARGRHSLNWTEVEAYSIAPQRPPQLGLVARRRSPSVPTYWHPPTRQCCPRHDGAPRAVRHARSPLHLAPLPNRSSQRKRRDGLLTSPPRPMLLAGSVSNRCGYAEKHRVMAPTPRPHSPSIRCR